MELYHSIEIGEGIRIEDVGQPNILVTLKIFITRQLLFFFNFQNQSKKHGEFNIQNQSKKPGEGANPFNLGISTKPISWEEYAQGVVRERKEKEMASTKDISIKVA